VTSRLSQERLSAITSRYYEAVASPLYSLLNVLQVGVDWLECYSLAILLYGYFLRDQMISDFRCWELKRKSPRSNEVIFREGVPWVRTVLPLLFDENL
jgi:hypothetical protein